MQHALRPWLWDAQLVFESGDYPHFETRRGYGVTFHVPGTRLCTIRVAPKLEQCSVSRIEGIMRHELGHVVDLLVPGPELDRHVRNTLGQSLPPREHGELRADAIALALWGSPLRYDKDLVQNTVEGVTPRPRRLGR